jgi:tripartite-type tricarboxylate transporter receptor subunit TctC
MRPDIVLKFVRRLGSLHVRLAIIPVVATVVLSSALSFAQSGNYPSRAITLITPFGAGSASDSVARIYADKLSQVLGKPVVVDNRSGAGGTIGAGIAARATPDGYTLLIATASTQTLNQHIYKNLPYNVEKDFAPVSLLTIGPLMISVSESFSARTMQELIELSKRAPDALNYGSDGVGTLTHIAGEMLKQRTGMKMLHIPFRGSADTLNAILTGSIQVASTGSGAIPLGKDGKLRILAVLNPTRFGSLPDVPTMAEVGIRDFNVATWFGLFAPTGTPTEIISQLNDAVQKTAKMPDVKSRLEALAQEATTSTPAELSKRVETDAKMWGEFIRSSGLNIEQ